MDELSADAVLNLDPMLYWCGRFLPLADSMGILRSRVLLRAFMPMAKFLPPVPVKRVKRLTAEAVECEREGSEWWRHSLLDHNLTIPETKFIGSTVYYVMKVDGKYAGEFRYRHLRELHFNIKEKLPKNVNFPPRYFRRLNRLELEVRRAEVEKYLVFVMSDPEICVTYHFVHFIKIHRRWSEEQPLLKSPLLT